MYYNANVNELQHHGVKGMRWGHKNGPPYPLDSRVPSHHVKRQAKKDAKEYARAKMFYGEGAGIRRKLINNTVKERSKDPSYKTEFDKAMSQQRMDKHVKKATSERKRKDAYNSVKKTGKGVVNIITGHPERLGASMAAAAAIYAAGKKTGINKTIAKVSKETASKFVSSVKTQYSRYVVNKILNK